MRLFVAIAIPEAVADPLCDLQGGLDGVRWVDPDDFHLTLRFVGDVDRGTADDLAAALSGLRAPAFDLRLSGLGHFGSGQRLRALWVGVEPQPALTLLHGRVEAAARRAGLPPEGRRFVPHVTLARMSGPISDDSVSHWIGSRSPFAAGPFPVRDVVLFESFLGREGPHYERRLTVPLDRLPDADDWDGEWDGPEPA
ncbi:RNA 2',3'-cyclic phosphodiesterase [Thalassobaculum sp.]|uniref:RNA 2',3'-cyclic phosphodiesterase n=1 Tax=Thalassobaculum sp. TaxID=2022740 RepID=UPI0032EDEC5E